jgi:hypothetical protein
MRAFQAGWRRWIGAASLIVLGASAAASAQRWWGMGEGRGYPLRIPSANFQDGSFTVCKLMFTSVRSEAMGMGWATDYPFAGINLMTRLSELTTAPVSRDVKGDPNHWVVRLSDEALFSCPFVMAADVGTIGLSPTEVERLRTYLLQGGFLWVDDFWGSRAWDHWVSQIGRVLPPSEFEIFDVPLDHPLLRMLYRVEKVPQITNIQFWRGVHGATTSERGPDSAEPHLRAIADPAGRILVLMTHNTDVADSWEREGEDPDFFYQFSPNGYALGLDVVIYSMTH